jgi:starch-binding outer membrane protein, SusD/RagB family
MKSKLIYTGLALMLTLPACQDALEENVFNFVAPQNFYQNATDAQAALVSVYDALQPGNMFGQAYMIGDMSTDDTFTGEFRGNPSRVQIDEFTIDANNAITTGRFEDSYLAINRANAVIDRVPAIEMDEDLKANVINQARFIRALIYFDLVRLYGDVPMKVRETAVLEEVGIPRTPVEQIYQEVIIPDLVAAENLPITQSDPGRATRGAAKALLAKVYLTRQEWALARDKAREVMELPGSPHGLLDNFADVFQLENQNSREHLFSVQFNSLQGEGSSFQEFFQPRGINSATGTGNGVNEPTFDIVEAFEPGDERFNATFIFELPLATGGVNFYDPTGRGNCLGTPCIPRPYIGKYMESSLPRGNLNYPVIRYSDVLLMYAEAANEAEGGPSALAFEAINQVRRRARLPELNGLSQEEFRQRVRQERRVELAFESQRRFDLIRWGIFTETMRAHAQKYYPVWAANVREHFELLPIPAREIDLNPAIGPEHQNPGY